MTVVGLAAAGVLVAGAVSAAGMLGLFTPDADSPAISASEPELPGDVVTEPTGAPADEVPAGTEADPTDPTTIPPEIAAPADPIVVPVVEPPVTEPTAVPTTEPAPPTAAPANTAPTVSVLGVSGGASYAKGSVPAATCLVTDAEDGNPSILATFSDVTGPYESDGIGMRIASCSYTDTGLLTASGSKTYSIVDQSAPAIVYTMTTSSPGGLNGWYTGDVSLVWSVSEPESPSSLVKVGCADQNIIGDQGATSYSCSATSAGGAATTVSGTVPLTDLALPRTSPSRMVTGTGGVSWKR